MSTTFEFKAKTIIGRVLELLSTTPEIVSTSNFTMMEDREEYLETVNLDQCVMAANLVPFLSSIADNCEILFSNMDMCGRDIIGCYGADDPRSNWWLFSSGSSFVHLPIGYAEQLTDEELEDGAANTSPLICVIDANDIMMLLEIFTNNAAKPEDLSVEEYDAVISRIRDYDKTKHKDIHALLGDTIKHTCFVPHRSYLEPSSYNDGMYIHSVDPDAPLSLVNTTIRIVQNGTTAVYYFKDETLHREPHSD